MAAKAQGSGGVVARRQVDRTPASLGAGVDGLLNGGPGVVGFLSGGPVGLHVEHRLGHLSAERGRKQRKQDDDSRGRDHSCELLEHRTFLRWIGWVRRDPSPRPRTRSGRAAAVLCPAGRPHFRVGVVRGSAGTSWFPTLHYRDSVAMNLDQSTRFANHDDTTHKQGQSSVRLADNWNFMGKR